MNKTNFAFTSCLLSAALFTSTAYAATTTYTTDAQFDSGVLDSVNHDAPNNEQLQINVGGDTFPVLWVANAGEDTMSRVNTDGAGGNGCEEARYLTAFGLPATLANHGAFSGPAPSRSAVDGSGNLYVANRHFTGGKRPELLKIAVEGGDDRNGNGVIDTSFDANGNCMIEPDEMLPVIDDNGDGIAQISEFRDERVIWISQFADGNDLGRSLCLDVAGNLWAGTYNGREYWKFDQNGVLIAGPIATSATNYGCAVTADGTLWGATLGSILVELNTNTNTWTANRTGQSNYGIAVGNSRVYLGSTLHGFNPATGVFQLSVASGGTGVQVDGLGNVWFGTPTLRKFAVNPVTGDLNTTPVCSIATLGGRGPIVGKGNNIWTINTNSNSVSQYDNDCNFISTIPVGRAPYTYSDATGFGARNQTDPTGIWAVITDGGAAGTPWDSVAWNSEPQGNVPAGASITVEARVADIVANLGGATYIPVVNGAAGLGLTGQFIQVRAVLRPNTAGDSPVLSDLSVMTAATGVQICDVDLDGDIDKLDLREISRARGQVALPNDPRDANQDGVITPSDTKVCIPLCTLANCAIQ
jgi:streptogramin lyase